MYEVMRYWDEDQPEWDVVDFDFAAAWRAKPKWVVSRSLKSVGANATLVAADVEALKTPCPPLRKGGAHVAALLCPAHLGLMRSNFQRIRNSYIDDYLYRRYSM